MSSIGNIWVDANTNRRYKCTAMITVSPTLIHKNELKSSVWEQLLGVSGESTELPKTIVLEDENGNKVVAVLVDGEIDFTASANDIREGMTAVTDEGVTIGTKFIPSYLVSEGVKIIPSGSRFYIQIAVHDLYDYTKLQAILCPFNESLSNSVSCEKVVINDNLYDALTTVSLSEIQLDSENKTIELGIENTASVPYLIRYFTYKEVY